MKTNDLEGDALDWAVAKCMGHADETIFRRLKPDEEGWYDMVDVCIAYSTDWAQGGPIIEWEKIGLRCGDNTWGVDEGIWEANHPKCLYVKHGATPLIAAMRCYVASKLGNEITIPEELK